jgi:hypothetical protein
LLSIVDYAVLHPAIDSFVFPDTPSTEFWTATPNAENTGFAWVVSFGVGFTSFGNMGILYKVRCVR